MAEIILGWEQPQASAAVGFTAPLPTPLPQRKRLLTSKSHTLVLAATGEGKGVSVAIPNLLHYDGSAIVVDIKGELATTTARYRREDLGQEVVVLDPWGETDLPSGRFNPLDLMLLLGEDVSDDAFMMAALLSDGLPAGKDPFWPERGQSLIAGLIVALTSAHHQDPVSLGSVFKWLHRSDPVFDLAMLLDKNPAIHPFASQMIGRFLSTVEQTRSGIESTASSMIRTFGGKAVQRATDASSFDLRKLVRGDPMTIYIVVPPRVLGSHSGYVRATLAALMMAVMRRKERPEKPTLFLIDEMAQLGAMGDVIMPAVTLSRSYGMLCLMFVQSLAQLRQHYPAETLAIIENCGSFITFGHSKRSMSNDVAAMLGDLSADALFGMKPTEAAVQLRGRPTQVVRKLNYLDDPLFNGRADQNRMYRRVNTMSR